MRKVSLVIALILGSSVILPSYVSAATPTAGAACAKAGLTNSTATKKFTCIKSGKKLVWDKGVAIVKPASAPVTATTSTASTASTASTTPGEGDPGSTLLKDGLCVAISAGTQVTAHLQLFINGSWKTSSAPVTWQNVGSCDSGHKERNSVPNASVMINDGTKYRWQVTPGAGGTGPDGLSPETTYKAPMGQSSQSAPASGNGPVVVQIAFTPCTSAGEMKVVDGLRYVCQGEGRQDHFQWDKGTPTSFVATIPFSLPVQQTGPITFSNALSHVSEIPTVAWQRIQDVINQNPDVMVPHQLIVGPKTTSVTKTLEESILAKEFKLWSGFKQPTYLNVIAYNSSDTDWAVSQFNQVYKDKGYASPQDPQMALHLVQQTCSASSQPGQTTGPMGDCYAGNAGEIDQSDDAFEMLGITTADPQHPWDPTQSGEVSHEYTHTVQGAQFIGTSALSHTDYEHIFMPCWMNEGQANASGVGVASTSSNSYLNIRNDLVTRGPIASEFKGFSAAGLKDFLYSQIPNQSISNSCYNNGPLYKMGYSVGFAATEALFAIGGPQSTMALVARGAMGENYAQAFQDVYGISWDEGSTILGQILAAEYSARPMKP